MGVLFKTLSVSSSCSTAAPSCSPGSLMPPVNIDDESFDATSEASWSQEVGLVRSVSVVNPSKQPYVLFKTLSVSSSCSTAAPSCSPGSLTPSVNIDDESFDATSEASRSQEGTGFPEASS